MLMANTVELRDARGLEVTTRTGRLRVIAERGRANIEVDGLRDRSRKRQIWRENGRIHIRSAQSANSVTVRCPEGVDLSVATTTGEIELRGDLGDVRAQSQSGRIDIEQARSVEARTKVGRIDIGAVHGKASAATASGTVEIERAHNARAATVSGTITLKDIRAAVDAMSVSGRVKVQTHGAGDIRVGTVSGSVEVRIPQNRLPKVHTKRRSGSLKNECAEGDDLRITVATVSGSVKIAHHRERVRL